MIIISVFREYKMAKRLRPLRVRYRLQVEWSTVAEKEALTSGIPQVRQFLRPPSSCSGRQNDSSERNVRCCRKRTNATARTSCAYRVATESFRFPFCIYVVINFLCMFIYDFSCINLVSVPCTIHFLDCHLALEFCAAYVHGLNNIRRHLRVSGGCVRPATLRIMCFVKALRPLYTLPRSEEAYFVLNFPAILNLIWAGPPPFIGACERRFPMNILLHVHYAMHLLYSQPIIKPTYAAQNSRTRW